MSKKYLIVPREDKCIGCRLCSLIVSKEEDRKLGIKNSKIIIKGTPGSYKVQIDYGADIKNPEKIVRMCPQNCFEVISE